MEKIKLTLLILLILIFFSSCQTEKRNNPDKYKVEPEVEQTESDTINDKRLTTGIVERYKTSHEEQHEQIEKGIFDFDEYKSHSLTDTIKIDLNGNGEIEKIYFTKSDDCKKLLIVEPNSETIEIGCKNKDHLDYPDLVDWVNQWAVVFDKKVHEVLITPEGDLDKDTITSLERPSIYIGKKEAGGGIITYRKNKLYWVHQSD